MGTWTNDGYKIIAFDPNNAGQDASDTDLINWLNANAEQIQTSNIYLIEGNPRYAVLVNMNRGSYTCSRSIVREDYHNDIVITFDIGTDIISGLNVVGTSNYTFANNELTISQPYTSNIIVDVEVREPVSYNVTFINVTENSIAMKKSLKLYDGSGPTGNLLVSDGEGEASVLNGATVTCTSGYLYLIAEDITPDTSYPTVSSSVMTGNITAQALGVGAALYTVNSSGSMVLTILYA